MDTQLALCTKEQSRRLNHVGFNWKTNKMTWESGLGIARPTVELALQWFEEVKGFKYDLQNNVNAGCWITPVFKGKYFAAIYAINSKQAKCTLLDELLTLIEEE